MTPHLEMTAMHVHENQTMSYNTCAQRLNTVVSKPNHLGVADNGRNK